MAHHTFEFTLKFSLPDSDSPVSSHIEQLAEAGCDDALIGIGQTGRIALVFDRKAQSAFKAVASAIADVEKAIPGARLIEGKSAL